MPNFEELKKIQAELRLIGQEPDVLQEWGEQYYDLPFPKESDVLDVDVDNLLGSIDIPTPTEASTVNKVDASSTGNDSFSPEAFAGFDDIPSLDNIVESSVADKSDTVDASNLENKEYPLDSVNLDDFKDVNLDDGSSFGDLISGLDLDSSVSDSDLDSNVPDMPEDFLKDVPDISVSDFDVGTINAKSDGLDMHSDITEVPVVPDLNSTDTDNESFEDVNIDDIGIENAIDSDVDSAGGESENVDASMDTPGFDLDISDLEEGTQIPNTNFPDFDISESESSENVNSELTENFVKSDTDPLADFDDGSLSDFIIDQSDAIDNSDFSNLKKPIEDNTEDLDINNIISGETFESVSDEIEEDPYAPVEDISDMDIAIPELDKDTGLPTASDGEVTEEDGGFSIPQNFQDFSTDDYKAFDVSEKKNEDTDADFAGKVPLAISEEKFAYFIKRVSSFPLNVRKELQNYIATGDDIEVNKMDLVDIVIKDGSLRKVVHYLEKSLKKSIKVPRGFERKSFEEYEREKRTFKYQVMHRIIPIATIACVLSFFVLSVGVLIHQFIYQPLVAESLYKDGMMYIENGKYNTAIDKFDQAGTYWKKRRWYFTFADEFRSKRQYTSAESIYLRLLYDFDHDVEGGIAYAEMLSKELRNYEKAETVLKRQVLDYHLNDPKALVSLGNVYLDWGSEIPEKYEEAGKIFANLLREDTSSDLYNAGMMKYYIRIDQLAKVLPFKDFFLRRGAKITSSDLTELGAYLLEKRYEPKPSDDEMLRGKIDDVRKILERSYKLDPNNPESNYNLGRFFIYNYKTDEAEFYLRGAIKNFEKESILEPDRFIKKMDSMRLYGELLLSKHNDLDAENIFSNALSFYNDYIAMRPIKQNKIIGKLFENYGDIKYFLANDYEMAHEAYLNAIKQLNNTSTIQYKLGFINYKLHNYEKSVEALSKAYIDKPNDKNLLYALGNVLFRQGNYFASQAYYERLMENLDAEKLRKGKLEPQVRDDHTEFVERYMHTANNLGVVLNRIAVQTGDSEKNARSFALFAESSRAWDSLTRNPQTMIRVKNDKSAAYINIQYMTVPDRNFIPEIYSDIPKTLEKEIILQKKEDK